MRPVSLQYRNMQVHFHPIADQQEHADHAAIDIRAKPFNVGMVAIIDAPVIVRQTGGDPFIPKDCPDRPHVSRRLN